ncbi:uncharacterized protein [Euphorbia lathyris]|uniref:uncharacterized protein isoform X1 n=1 Tax=Euphorbia lathyris TaxID=212925 RepID=UPI0033138F6B
MDRSWMYGNRASVEFLRGLGEFSKVAIEFQSKSGSIRCPCCHCNNMRCPDEIYVVQDHLICGGFKKNYTSWTWHGEMFDNAESSTKAVSHQVGDADVENDSEVEVDRINDMMHDVEDDFTECPGMYDRILSSSETPLYPSCTTFTILSAVLKLFNLKVSHSWTDKSFTELLQILKKMLPDGNEVPISTYEAKKLMCPMGMEYEKIHACRNDCVLYRNDYADMQAYPRCGVSRYKRKDNDSCLRKKGVPAKVLWYLPIIPRFKRLFSDENNAKLLRWHDEGRKKDGLMRHPADSSQWRTIDRKFKDFGQEVRNLRLGLCTDGMNPFGTLSTQYSTWPVLLTIYNLPSWLCMKRRYIMLSVLISGPKQPGNDIDVYLAPLIDDLKLLWDEGVSVFDAYSRTNFTLHAMIFCTINDFPAYGNLPGYTVKGKMACPICEDDMEAVRLHHCGKHVYMNHRRFLPLNHPFRRKKKAFNGTTEKKKARLPLCGSEVYDRVKGIETVFGKPNKSNTMGGYKKMSIFWKLPYWEHLEVRHCLDVMHIEKNVCDAIVGTLLNMSGKTKDGVNARRDMAEMGRSELAPQERGKRYYLPPACYTLSKAEKTSFCESLHGLKVPAGYCSNFRRIVSLTDLKLVGMKSHDCHVLMQQFLPVAIRGILPPQVRYTITRLCLFFHTICSQVIDPTRLDALQADIVQTMCGFEMYFPPSFFDVMPNLVVHIVCEIKLCGPVCLRYMYPFEREMGTLKGSVMNLARPEASIVQRTVAEEVASWCSQYLADTKEIGVPKSRHYDRLHGKGTVGRKSITLSAELLGNAELYVLQTLSEVHPYLDEHMAFLRSTNPSKTDAELMKLHNKSFIRWFKSRVMSEVTSNSDVSSTLRWLAYGCKIVVSSYEGYDINGYSFYTKRQDDKSVMQNSGVTVVGLSSEYASARDKTLIEKRRSYYGFIDSIFELDYVEFKIALLQCKWVDSSRGIQNDEHGFLTLVNFNRLGHHGDPFILASQAKQVFYMVDPVDPQLSIVLEGKRRILGIDDVVDEEEYDEQFDETACSPFDIPTIDVVHEVDTNFTRQDHDEGFYVTI